MKLGDFSFRLWSSREKHYITNNLCLVEFNHNPGEIKAGLLFGEYGNYDFIENYDDKFEIELWTGYCDKNGKNIYENDIVKVEDNGNASIFKVGFSNNMGFSASLQTEAILPYQLKILASKGFEIIGNIHENAELLNENKPS
ncbi:MULTISPECIES: YopX family protein [unclassified Campylobacter]|uniref:YopX family protein n=1 Tax=unclassified Campylobacter TaxID=2593542 RepID=UPI0008741CC1|nr:MULTISPECIES: YopX family protein [unclassified Campylobacter]EGD0208523.1 hypothetical protein [Campylobacter jejuni]OEW69531.1 hypothetical protein AJN59_01570 [Campylobacter sp. BCW_4322]OEW78702.1 hypothetical protein AJN65_02385 [Campylobacter sp. BCW_4333]OEW80940.1 hypothetical protein AJN68_01275 [Campylobacter sp. BCW_4337]OEW84734.1 hypothetical protein AJN69_01870 [Campylobacter sp. BCW_4338]